MISRRFGWGGLGARVGGESWGDMDRRLLRSIVLLTVIVACAVLGVAIYFAQRSVEVLSHSLIDQATERTEVELERFFGAVEEQLREGQAWGRRGMIDVDDSTAFLQLFAPFLETHPQVTGIEFAREDGVEIYVLVEERGFATRRLTPRTGGGSIAKWERWREGRVTERWSEEIDYEPRTRPWFTGAMALSDERSLFWSEPYTFYTTKVPGITASTKFKTGGSSWVAGIDLSLVDISRFTTTVGIPNEGRVVVVTPTGRLIGLPKDPRFDDREAIRSAMLQPIEALRMPMLTEGLARLRGPQRSPFHYEVDGLGYWAGTRTYYLTPNNPLLVHAIFPENSLLGGLEHERNVVLLLLVLVLAGGMAIAFLLHRANEERMKKVESEVRQLGQYTLERKIGSGGMGAVYRARHALLRRPTAVKLLAPRKEDPEAFNRFEREVQLTAQLTHPNTIAIYDYGRTEGGVFYYAMEYLEGLSLRQLIKYNGPIGEARAIHILRQVAGSLQEAHQAGLVHRDIKPANIFLTQRGGLRDFVKVLDFGLVEKAGTRGREEGSSKRVIVGTPAYMAPEIIRDSDHVTPFIDIYAFGCLAYYLLTGQPVFRGDSQRTIYKKQLEDAPIPPSSHLKASISKAFEDLILQCLRKSPKERPASMRALIDGLDSLPLSHHWGEDEATTWWNDNLGKVRERKDTRRKSKRKKTDGSAGKPSKHTRIVESALDRAIQSIAVDLAARKDEPLVIEADSGFSFPSVSSNLADDASIDSSNADPVMGNREGQTKDESRQGRSIAVQENEKTQLDEPTPTRADDIPTKPS